MPIIFILLALALMGFGVLLFLPTIMEYRKPKDLGPREVAETTVDELTKYKPAFQPTPSSEAVLPESITRTLIALADKEIFELGEGNVRIIGDIELPSDVEINENLIVEGSVKIGSRCHLHGDIKTLGHVEVGNETKIDGNLISGGDVRIGSNVSIKGLLDAKGKLELGEGSHVGLSASSAGDVLLHESVKIGSKIITGGRIQVSIPTPIPPAPVLIPMPQPPILTPPAPTPVITQPPTPTVPTYLPETERLKQEFAELIKTHPIEESANEIKIAGDYRLPPNSVVTKNLTVVDGSIYIGAGSRINGTVKSEKNFGCGTNVVIDGDVICDGDAILGHSASINGKLTTNGNLMLGDYVAITGTVMATGAVVLGRNIKVANLVAGGPTHVFEYGKAETFTSKFLTP